MSKLALLGGDAVRIKDFPNRKSMGEEEKKAALRVLDGDVLSGFIGAGGKFFNGGKEVNNFESLWKETFGFKHAISVNSWTTGLQACFAAIGVEPGDEIICPPYTMSASATAAIFYGGIPVFADIDPDRFTIDPESIRKKITNKTKAIVVVHLFGYSAEMDKILEIAKSKNIRIIEDAAQAPGTYYKNKFVGALGDIGGFSLNFHKHIHTGEGGLIVTNDDNLALKSQLVRNHGENAIDFFEVDELSNLIGSNYRYTELQAAIAIEQFKKLKGILDYREKLAKILDKRLKNIPGLKIQKLEDGCNHAYYMYPIKFNDKLLGISRSNFVQAVSAELPRPKFWDTTPMAEGYVKPIYLSPLYQKKIALGSKGYPWSVNRDIDYKYNKGCCPVTENLYERELIVSPLIREGISEKDINDFANAIEKVIININDLRDYFKTKKDEMIFDPIAAIEKNID